MVIFKKTPKRTKMSVHKVFTNTHKLCRECEQYILHNEFYLDGHKKCGLSTYCKKCTSKINKAKVIAKNKIIPPKIVKGRKLSSNESYIRRKEKIKSKGDEYLKSYLKKKSEYNKQYRKDNRDRIRYVQNTYKQNKLKTNALYKLKESLLSRISCGIVYSKKKGILPKNFKKTASTVDILGVDIATVQKYLERKFTKGMNWNNHGEWHIDHIIPLASAKNEEELIKLFHYTNLQPLWAKDNLVKNKYIPQVQTKLTL